MKWAWVQSSDGDGVVSVTRYRQYAADCLRQAEGEASAGDKTIILNVALAWIRLAQQTEDWDTTERPPIAADEAALSPISS
jgi:hypothetical protein